MFWVVWRLSGHICAAFIAGLIYQMWPYRMARLDLPNMLATYWIPLFLLFLILSIKDGSRRSALLAGMCLALVGYARWQFLIPTLIMGLIILIFYAPLRTNGAWCKLAINLTITGTAALVLLLPAALLLLRDAATYSDLVNDDNEERLMSADLFAFATPAQQHPLFSASTQPLHDRYYYDRERLRRRPAYIGLIPLLLAIAGIIFYRRRAWPWAAIFLVLLLLALGPTLRINGSLYERIPTLSALLSPLRILELMRYPERFVIFIALPLAVLAGYGLAGILDRNSTLARTSWLLPAILGALIFFEFYTPQSVLRDHAHPSALYAELSDQAGSFAVLNLPFDDLKTRSNMAEQTLHGRPLVQGNLSRIPTSAYSYIEENPWLSTLNQTAEISPEWPDVGHQLGLLAGDGIRYLILHKDKVGRSRIARWQRALIIEPRFEDEQRILYSTAPEAGRDFIGPVDWAPGPAPLSVSLSANCLHTGHPLLTSIGWGTGIPSVDDLEAHLALIDSAGQEQLSARYLWCRIGLPAPGRTTLFSGHITSSIFPIRCPPVFMICSSSCCEVTRRARMTQRSSSVRFKSRKRSATWPQRKQQSTPILYLTISCAWWNTKSSKPMIS